ncbi:hypothetical protein MVLG_06627 [Microbotryum lychnidis-dioicae p1A1 Lamole]|uniref:Protein BFR2 n=1 Tax=Microbotryum lychnidis-dioicae (strain p1A1 Lamole / MvSl-1064) TaxID=683840 RepID=U5HHV6_USTV1|nr:hypothetical protein MVLG_06627 [Microbotryum lychnidis-dioicae p1A1 Lamole]|eukprot:KDE02836.1 hypothetical protein MVLG_06627 [Microbotryum lychnidis-dioicae p1A1 Lamole]
MSKRLTLADQLAQIAEPAPQDFDPEDSYATYANERNKGEQAADLEAGRAEYLPVGPGGLRKKGEALVDSKYDGKKGSRRTMFGGEEEEDEGHNEDDEDEDSEQDDDGGDDFDDLVGSEDSHEFASADQDDNDDDDEGEHLAPIASTSNKQAPPSALKTSTKSSITKGKSADERAMISQLRTAAHADIEKGIDVKKQFSFCDSVLESRIKLQKAVTAINVLPRPANAEMYYQQVEEERERARLEVEALNEELFKLRSTMLKGKEQIQIQLPTNLGQSRKRHRNPDSAQEYLAATVKDLAAIETALEPFLRTTITKWSDKVLAASGLALGKDKKFKAVNQNAMAQIDHALGPLERERLVKRTRLRRTTDRAVVGQADLGTLEGEKTPVDEEVFDDGDFYQQLLRDVIESRMLDLDDPTLESLRQATARSKKQKKVVDTRASKGRKIRYHVHDKLQNFMVPIEAGGWHEEKVDELFASLLGRSFPQVKSNDEEASKVSTGRSGATASEHVDAGSLRIFG